MVQASYCAAMHHHRQCSWHCILTIDSTATSYVGYCFILSSDPLGPSDPCEANSYRRAIVIHSSLHTVAAHDCNLVPSGSSSPAAATKSHGSCRNHASLPSVTGALSSPPLQQPLQGGPLLCPPHRRALLWRRLLLPAAPRPEQQQSMKLPMLSTHVGAVPRIICCAPTPLTMAAGRRLAGH